MEDINLFILYIYTWYNTMVCNDLAPGGPTNGISIEFEIW